MENNKTSDIQILLHNITFLRKHHGLSKRKMAALLHIGIPNLNKIESGVLPNRLSSAVLFHLEDHFHFTPKELLTQWLEE